jgi:hypothetical protein
MLQLIYTQMVIKRRCRCVGGTLSENQPYKDWLIDWVTACAGMTDKDDQHNVPLRFCV